MNKTDLITAAAEKSGLSKKDAERVVNALLDTLTTSLAKGEKVQISGFCIFETKEPVQIPATRTPTFKPSKLLKDIVGK